MHPSVEYTCDLCTRTTQATDHVKITWHELHYRVDLCKKHAKQVESVITTWVDGIRPVSRKKAPARVASAGGYTPRQVRQWAELRGIDVPALGRIPRAVVKQFLDDTRKSTASRSATRAPSPGKRRGAQSSTSRKSQS